MIRRRALLFDLDGTLIDSYEAIHESLNVALARAGMPPRDAASVRRMVGRGLDVLVAEVMGPERAPEGVRDYREHYGKVCFEKTRLLPGVAPTLERLASDGHAMAICTNKLASFSRALVDHLGVGGFFALVLGPEHVKEPKPDPGMLLLALEKLGADRRDALYVGDMAMDVTVARAAGVEVAVLPTGSSSREELASAGADHLLEVFADLPAVIGPGAGA
ncbi:MAG: HAD-IA family hydrolase [Acidobacteriota bacterium]